MITLAENSVDPNFAWQLMLCLAAAAHFGVMILKGIAHWQTIKAAGKPLNIEQPLVTREHVAHAEKPELDKLSEAVSTLTATVNSNHNDLKLKGSERESSIKDLLRAEVSTVMRELSGVKDSINKDLTSVRERLASVETRLDKLPSE